MERWRDGETELPRDNPVTQRALSVIPSGTEWSRGIPLRYLEGFMAGSLDVARDDRGLLVRIVGPAIFAAVHLVGGQDGRRTNSCSARVMPRMPQAFTTTRLQPLSLLPRAQKQESDAAGAHPLNGVTRNLPRVIQS
jgi:hypothetical protein